MSSSNLDKEYLNGASSIGNFASRNPLAVQECFGSLKEEEDAKHLATLAAKRGLQGVGKGSSARL